MQKTMRTGGIGHCLRFRIVRGWSIMDAVIIRKVDFLPLSIKGMTVLDTNGDYNIYLNAKLAHDEQVRAFRHELEHIRQGHFYSASEVASLERSADQGT